MAQKKSTTSKKGASGKNAKQNTKQGFFEKNIKKLMLSCFALFLVFSIIALVGGSGVWTTFRAGIFAFFGIGLYVFNLMLLVYGIFFALNRPKRSFAFGIIGSLLLVVSFCALVTVISVDGSESREFADIYKTSMSSAYDIPTYGFAFSGGIIGGALGGGLLSLLGKAPSIAILAIIFIISFFLAFDISVGSVGDKVAGGISKSKDKIDEGKSNLSEKHSENRARRRETRDIRSEERKAILEKKRLDELEERRRKIKEQNENNEARRNSLLTPPGELTDDFLVEQFGEDLVRNSSTENNLTPDSTDKDGKTRKPEVDVTSSTTARSITGRVSISDDGFNYSTGDEPFRVINGQPFPVDNTPKPQPSETPKPKRVKKEDIAKKAKEESKSEEKKPSEKKVDNTPKQYLTPPIDCLNLPDNVGFGNTEQEMNETAEKLIETLRSFGVETKIVGASRGPSVTRYELQPAMGVRINKITNLADDIALNLASAGIRIEAPIPGKSAVGIEVPNKARESVTLREIISSPEYEVGSKKSKLNVAIGKDIAGQVNCADLSRMPHLLVAGTTGSGKSVTMNDMIVSLLYNASPDEVKILLIDPKQVEFAVYNGIPHLYVPVISDAKKASGALTWAVTEMERRYKLFSICGVRDLASYNRYIKANPDPDEIMHSEPQVVIFIDELADLMMVSPKEVEDAICRLAQKARAAGMHLVVATQRPSVDVVTGLIKANIPSRLALSVSSQVDSRTILDTAGAEKLLGNGDLLFNPLGVNKPIRIQGAFVSEEEIERVVDFLRDKTMPDYDSAVMEQIDKFAAEAGSKKGSAQSDADDKPSSGDKVDAMFDDVLRFACENGEISGSLIMRKFSLGYGRSAKIIDQLIERGYLGEVNTSTKKRPVLITIDKYWEMKSAGEEADTSAADADDDDDDDDDYTSAVEDTVIEDTEEVGSTHSDFFDEPVDDDFDIFDDE